MINLKIVKKSICFFDCGCCLDREHSLTETERHIVIPDDILHLFTKYQDKIIINLSDSQEPCAFYLDEVFEQLLPIYDKIKYIIIKTALATEDKYVLEMINAINFYQNIFHIKVDVHIFPLNEKYVEKHLENLKQNINDLKFHYVTDFSNKQLEWVGQTEKKLKIKINLNQFVELNKKKYRQSTNTQLRLQLK